MPDDLQNHWVRDLRRFLQDELETDQNILREEHDIEGKIENQIQALRKMVEEVQSIEEGNNIHLNAKQRDTLLSQLRAYRDAKTETFNEMEDALERMGRGIEVDRSGELPTIVSGGRIDKIREEIKEAAQRGN